MTTAYERLRSQAARGGPSTHPADEASRAHAPATHSVGEAGGQRTNPIGPKMIASLANRKATVAPWPVIAVGEAPLNKSSTAVRLRYVGPAIAPRAYIADGGEDLAYAHSTNLKPNSTNVPTSVRRRSVDVEVRTLDSAIAQGNAPNGWRE